MGKRVLITHIGWFLSEAIARRLEEDPSIDYIVGVGRHAPRGELKRTEFVRVDMRKPVLSKIIDAAGIDTVVHLGLYSTPIEAGGRGAMHDLNVIGAMQLFAACQRSESVSRVIVRSSTAVYGAGGSEQAIFSERSYPDPGHADPFGSDCQEIESYARELVRRRNDIAVTTLRLANVLGPTSDTPVATYLAMRVVPTILGFDPRLQFLHEDDAMEIFALAVNKPTRGVYNVAGRGVVYLSQAIRQGGRIDLPVPAFLMNRLGSLTAMLGGGLNLPPHVLRLIHWGRVVEIQSMISELGFTPKFSTVDVVREFYAERRLRRLAKPSEEDSWDSGIREYLARKGQERFSGGPS